MRRSCVGMMLLMLLSCAALGGTAAAAEPATDVWDGVTVTEPTRTKTIDGKEYWQIFTCAELVYVMQHDEHEWVTGNYSLEADLVINDTVLQFDAEGNCTNAEGLNPWTSLDNFWGIFRGNGHTVSGIYMVVDDYYAGFFRKLNGGSVYDLNIVNSYIKGTQAYVGGICGEAGAYTNQDWMTGTYEGQVSEIRNCSYEGVVVAPVGAGGIVGHVWANGEENYTDPSTFPTITVAGCTFSGDLFSSSGSYSGGIIGVLGGKWGNVYVEDCVNQGNVMGNVEVGGIVGQLLPVADLVTRIDGCRNQGSVYAETQVAGGILGICTGIGDTLIQYCVNEGEVTSQWSAAGGIVGTLSSRDNYGHNAYYQDKNLSPGRQEVRFCVNKGDVTANATVGGLVAAVQPQDEGTILIHDSYSAGDLTVKAGGAAEGSPLVGSTTMYESGTFRMECCYAAGTLSGGRPGGVTGEVEYYDSGADRPVFRHCRWLKTMATAAVGQGSGATLEDCLALTGDQMKKEENFAGFDFEEIWFYDPADGYEYPKLRERPETGVLDDVFDWEWSATAQKLTVMPKNTAAGFAVVAQYDGQQIVYVGLFDLNGGAQSVRLEDPDGVKTVLFLLDGGFCPL